MSGSGAWTAAMPTPSATGIRIGVRDFGTGFNDYMDGYIQDLRIYKGLAKYTSNFIPASTSPDILPDTPSGVSGGSKLTKVTDGAVAFDNSGDSLTVPDHADFDLGTNSFTIECFAYLQTIGQFNNIFAVGTDSSNGYRLDISTSNNLRLLAQIGGSWSTVITGGTALASNKWYHLVVTRSGNNFDLWVDGIKDTTTVSNSGTITNPTTQLEIGRLTTNSLNRNFHGFISNLRFVNGTALYTSDFTPPTRALTNVTNTKLLCCQSVAEQQNNFIRMFRSDTLYTTKADILANATEIFGAESLSNEYWYIVPIGTEPIDGANNKVFSTDAGWGTQSRFYWRDGSSWTQTVGGYSNNDYSTVGGGVGFSYQDNDDVDSYAIYPARDFLVGSQNTGTEPSTLTGNVPSTIKYYKLNGAVKPGSITANGNAAPTNFNPFTTDINAVRGQETGYATFNPLDIGPSSTLSNGNLYFQFTGGTVHRLCNSTISMSSGKWYWEGVYGQGGVGGSSGFGIAKKPINLSDSVAQTNVWAYHSNGNRYVNGSGSAMGATYTTGDLIGIAFDADSGTLYGYKNGVLQGTVATGLTSDSYFAVANSYSSSNWLVNFGQKPFKYAPPDGFQPLNAANVRPSTVITRPDRYVGVTTYSGNGGTIGISSYSFKPDLVWTKSRTSTYDNALFDSVRGATYRLTSNTQGGSNPEATTLTAFTNNGFTGGDSLYLNGNGEPYVAWAWKAGGGGITTSFWKDDVDYGTAAAAGLTGGDITPTGASIGTKQGFSILKFTAPSDSGTKTISHGLSQTPEFYIFKETNRSSAWYIFHHSVCDTNAKFMRFDATDLQSGAGNVWGNLPTSSLISIQNGSLNAVSSQNILYAWHSVPGLQKFGTYTGNANADGPFVELGFSPKVIWIKRSSTGGGNWICFDIERDKYNFTYKALYLNSNTLEGDLSSYTPLDILSNGFKLRDNASTLTGNTNLNISGGTYIYCAWAEAPSFNLYGGQSNAR
jgi:hypothetical protein